MLNLKEKVMNKQEVKKFKGRCVIHPGLFVGATNFDTILDEATASETMGYGVFTDQDIPAGTILEECISAKERIPIDDDQGILSGYRFPCDILDNKGNKGYRILLGMTSLCNHSDSENAYIVDVPEFIRMTALIASKNIKAGEQIFLNYSAVSGTGDYQCH